jgi:hypothetical protein
MRAYRQILLFKATATVTTVISLVQVLASPVGAQTPPTAPAASPAAAGAPGVPGSKPKKPYVFNVPNMRYVEDLPTNFPIPPYTSNIVKKRFVSTAKGSGKSSASENLVTRDKVDVVYNWYKDFCKNDGWTYKTPRPEQSSKTSKNGPIYMIDASKGNQHVGIFCVTHPKDQTTMVSLTWSKSKY